MGIVGAYVITGVSHEPLKSDPYIGLYIFHQVTDMDRSIGVGKRAGNQNSPGGGIIVGIGCHGMFFGLLLEGMSGKCGMGFMGIAIAGLLIVSSS